MRLPVTKICILFPGKQSIMQSVSCTTSSIKVVQKQNPRLAAVNWKECAALLGKKTNVKKYRWRRRNRIQCACVWYEALQGVLIILSAPHICVLRIYSYVCESPMQRILRYLGYVYVSRTLLLNTQFPTLCYCTVDA